LAAYLAAERSHASASAPLFVVRYRARGGHLVERRILGQRIWKLVKALGRRVGIPELHPHAFRHGCGVELHRRPGGNLRAVQAYLRPTDIQTTTVYTQLTGQDLADVVRVFDQAGDERKFEARPPRMKTLELPTPMKSAWWLQREVPVRLWDLWRQLSR